MMRERAERRDPDGESARYPTGLDRTGLDWTRHRVGGGVVVLVQAQHGEEEREQSAEGQRPKNRDYARGMTLGCR